MAKWWFIEYNDFTESVKWVNTVKINYTEKQYVQIAKEQFCQVVKEVPMISDIEIVPTGLQRGFGDFCAILHNMP